MMRTGAEISPCGLYRYRLWRTWDEELESLPFVMLNPSTADANFDDRTIRRCIAFAKREKYGGIVVANLFAFRATKPNALKSATDPIGPRNEATLASICHTARYASVPVLCAWGNGGGDRGRWFKQWAKANGARLVCLSKTAEGHPRHPLYVSGDQSLEEFA